MLNRLTSLAMSTSILEALPGKHDIKSHSPSIRYLFGILTCEPSIYTLDHLKFIVSNQREAFISA